MRVCTNSVVAIRFELSGEFGVGAVGEFVSTALSNIVAILAFATLPRPTCVAVSPLGVPLNVVVPLNITGESNVVVPVNTGLLAFALRSKAACVAALIAISPGDWLLTLPRPTEALVIPTG